ncbi:two-component system, LytT family, sensor histidine kinase AlgZ [Ectothiorhodospira magna]|uniref:Two-component system, LytT family, sensor histidine kinase AlgZ n=1 Tax=Ectothiorhodospira magna TaxID=867345 RepID=A0A1H9AD29_9GAMM|nr:sensor histidine kinase [Ectothiorhodospira magna]SEP74525.1 two-component system, LytT family, sensor histidine kinase AlgZ [Ectothiorhodospira magna]
MRRPSLSTGTGSPTTVTGFLPDFGRRQTLLLVILSGQVLAFLLALASSTDGTGLWINLLLISLFVHTVALSMVWLLCWLRPWLATLADLLAAVATWGIMVAITGLFTLLTLWLDQYTGWVLSRSGLSAEGFLLRTLGISAIVSAVALRYLYVQKQWQNNVKAEARSRVQALQARIRPHFLFNCMNTIASLTRTRPEVAEATVMDLADLFRATLSTRDMVTLEEDIALTQNYLRIEALRLGERLRVEWQVASTVPLHGPVPSLTLQPLLENAVYHGIEPLTEGGVIRVHIKEMGDRLYISIENPMPPEQERRRRPGNRLAQDNIRQRLALAYRGRAQMTTHQAPDRYRVDITLPR